MCLKHWIFCHEYFTCSLSKIARRLHQEPQSPKVIIAWLLWTRTSEWKSTAQQRAFLLKTGPASTNPLFFFSSRKCKNGSSLKCECNTLVFAGLNGWIVEVKKQTYEHTAYLFIAHVNTLCMTGRSSVSHCHTRPKLRLWLSDWPFGLKYSLIGWIIIIYFF